MQGAALTRVKDRSKSHVKPTPSSLYDEPVTTTSPLACKAFIPGRNAWIERGDTHALSKHGMEHAGLAVVRAQRRMQLADDASP